MDNRWVVPHNRALSLMFNAHINVEVVTSVRSVKYLYKYVHKGPDAVSYRLDAVGGAAGANCSGGTQTAGGAAGASTTHGRFPNHAGDDAPT